MKKSGINIELFSKRMKSIQDVKEAFSSLSDYLWRQIGCPTLDAIIAVGSEYGFSDSMLVNAKEVVNRRYVAAKNLFQSALSDDCVVILPGNKLDCMTYDDEKLNEVTNISPSLNEYVLTYEFGHSYMARKWFKNCLSLDMGTTSLKGLPVVGGLTPYYSPVDVNPNITLTGILTPVSQLEIQAFFRQQYNVPIFGSESLFDVLGFLSRYSKENQELYSVVKKALSLVDPLIEGKSEPEVSEQISLFSHSLSSLYLSKEMVSDVDIYILATFIVDSVTASIRKNVIKTLLSYKFDSVPALVLSGIGESFLEFSLDGLGLPIKKLKDIIGEFMSANASLAGLAQYASDHFKLGIVLKDLTIEYPKIVNVI